MYRVHSTRVSRWVIFIANFRIYLSNIGRVCPARGIPRYAFPLAFLFSCILCLSVSLSLPLSVSCSISPTTTTPPCAGVLFFALVPFCALLFGHCQRWHFCGLNSWQQMGVGAGQGQGQIGRKVKGGARRGLCWLQCVSGSCLWMNLFTFSTLMSPSLSFSPRSRSRSHFPLMASCPSCTHVLLSATPLPPTPS